MDYYILTPFLFILRILEIFAQFTLTLSISNIKFNIKKVLFSSLLFTLPYELVKIVLPQYLTSIIAAILFIFITTMMFKINYKKSILYYLLTGVAIATIDCIICTCILKISNLQSFEELSQSSFFMGIAKILIIITVFILSQILKNTQFNFSLHKTINAPNNTILIQGVITFASLIPNLVMILYYHDQKQLPLYIIVINIIAIISTFFINIGHIQNRIKQVQTEEELINEKIHSKTQEQLVDSLRTFKHDYGNLLQTMHGYIFIKDMDGLTEYFEQVLRESKIITALDRLSPEMFNNSSLYGLVTAKFEYARRNCVAMNLEMYTKLNNLEIGSYDLTRILGILLDNAIEASIGSKRKIVNFYVSERNNKVIIEISNSFSDTGLRIEDIYKKGVSSKGENRGLGLYKVDDILKRYPKVEKDTKITSDIFLQRLIINKVELPVS